MDSELLQRVMKLAEKTGDRVIIVNPESGTAFAVLPFDAYEKLADGSASLRSLDDVCDLDFDSGVDMDFDEPKEAAPQSVVKNDLEEKINADIATWNLAQQSEKENEGTMPLDVLDDEANEDQYYLEPIE